MKSWLKGTEPYLEWAGHSLAPQSEITVVFVSRDQMTQLNSQFRSLDRVTDILSFEGDGLSLGELVLCGEVLEAQALDHGLSLEQELGYLLIHGLLHLLGYVHEQGGDPEAEMFHWQDLMFYELWPQFFEGYWNE